MRISTIRQRGGHQAVRRRRSKQIAIPTRSIEAPSITPHFSDELGSGTIIVECKPGLAQIKLTNGMTTETLSYDCSLSGQKTYSVTIVPEDFDQSKPLCLEVLGCNGRNKRCSDAWKMVIRDVVRITNSKIILRKESAIGIDLRPGHDNDEADVELKGHKWAVMLQEKGVGGKLSRAKTIDLRIGAILDGAVVYYEDGHSTPCGLRYTPDGSKHHFGGGNSQKFHIPSGVDIVKVEVNRFGWGNRVLGGITMTLSNGTKAGSLNKHRLAGRVFANNDIKVLEAGVGEKIVGFYGSSSHYTEEFGIITGPKDVELPAQTYDMRQLQNIQARGWARNK
ncbi:hypothetical protein KCU98_g283, partial [Aureobasidium melanogenum]